MQVYPTLSTQVIGQAESALGALLDPILARAETSFHQWLVLTVTMAAGGEIDRGQLVARISGARKIERTAVASAIDELLGAELIEGDRAITVTGRGRARHSQIRSAIDALTARLFDFPAEDLATAGRVLTVVTTRANAELAPN
jgi:DNA-binding MarR family transcriptional regulator